MARRFRFGVQVARADTGRAWRDLARRVEDMGISTLQIPDHFGDQLAPIPALQSAADATETLRVGPLVLANDYRHPVVLAKEAATIDLLTEGRLEFGIGAGWMRTDYDESGLPYDSPGTRIERLEEALEIMVGLWGDGPVDHSGRHYTVTGLEGTPKPVQEPRPPILIGGGGPRVLRLAGKWADIVGLNANLRAGEVSPDVGSDVVAEMTEQKVAWAREGASDRFDDVELGVLVFAVLVTDDREGTVTGLAEAFGLTPEQALEVPHVLVGSQKQIVETIEERRERYGISYLTIQESALDTIGPIVDQLAGT